MFLELASHLSLLSSVLAIIQFLNNVSQGNKIADTKKYEASCYPYSTLLYPLYCQNIDVDGFLMLYSVTTTSENVGLIESKC